MEGHDWISGALLRSDPYLTASEQLIGLVHGGIIGECLIGVEFDTSLSNALLRLPHFDLVRVDELTKLVEGEEPTGQESEEEDIIVRRG